MSQDFGYDITDFISRNVVKVTDGRTFGTGFFIQKEHCVTCHHLIFEMDKLSVEYDNSTYNAEWASEYSDIEKDISILRVKGCNAKPLFCARQALPDLRVWGYGFLGDLIQNLPRGTQFSGKLETGRDEANFGSEASKKKIRNEWNIKPAIRVKCYKINADTLGGGLSGSPVFYPVNWVVVGMFMANIRGSDKTGYTIPIEHILDKFQGNIAIPAHTINSESFIHRGNEYYNKREYEKAIESYDIILNDTNYNNAFNNKASALHELGKVKQAIQCLDKAIELNPNDIDAWYNKGLFLSSVEEDDPKKRLAIKEEQLRCYEKAIEINPNYEFAWNNKGALRFEFEDIQEALRCFERFIEINPDYPNVWVNKGLCLYKMNTKEEAKKCFERAIQIDPKYAYAWRLKGEMLMEFGEDEEAKKCFERAQQIDPRIMEEDYMHDYPIHKVD